MTSVTLLRLAGPLAALGAAAAVALSAEPASEPAKTEPAKTAVTPAKPAAEPAKPASETAGPCWSAASALNEGKAWEAFDKLNGAGDRRLRFRLEGKEPCAPAGDCKVSIVARVAATDKTTPTEKAVAPDKPAAEKVIATVSLAGRTASYCVYGMSRVSGPPAPRREGCPGAWLENFLAIKLVDGDGPFARRDISIRYLYRAADAGAASLDTCASPAILDGMFRRRQWTVALDDGSAAFIGEIDFPRDRRAPVPQDAPFAASVAASR